MSKTIEEILAPKPEARPRLYAYSFDDQAHQGLLKVGQTTRAVKQRVAEQLKTANIKNYTIVLNESAERDDGTLITGPVQKPSPSPSVVCSTPSDRNDHEPTQNHRVLPWLALYFDPALLGGVVFRRRFSPSLAAQLGRVGELDAPETGNTLVPVIANKEPVTDLREVAGSTCLWGAGRNGRRSKGGRALRPPAFSAERTCQYAGLTPSRRPPRLELADPLVWALAAGRHSARSG